MRILSLAAIASFNLAALSIFAQAGSLTHRYNFNEGTANDSVGSANGTLYGNAAIQSGQLVLPNVAAATPATDYLQLPPGIVTNDPAVTVESWVTFSPNQYTWANLFDFGNQDANGYSEYDIHICLHTGNNSTVAGISDSDSANSDYQFIDLGPGSDLDGQTNLCLTTVFNPPAGYIAIFTNGTLAGGASNVTIQMSGVQDVRNMVGTDNWSSNPGMQGSIDEFRIYNFALSAAQVQGDFLAGPNTLSPVAAVIVSPSNTVYSGTSVTFDLTATGTSPFQFQWLTNMANLPGATNSTLVLTNVAVSDGGDYEVVISNSSGSSTSAPITLVVIPPTPPSFTVEPTPAAATNYAGGLTSFSTVVGGTPPISLQWQHQGTNIAGATTAQLSLANLSTNDDGSYTLVASNAFGTNVSTASTLTVLPPPINIAPNVLTSRYNNSRSGANTNEFLLTPANVNVSTFGRLFSYPVDGYVYTQPLYVANLTIPGQGTHNVVFVASENDTVYAFDADSNLGTNGGLLWQTNLGVAILSDNNEFGGRYGAPFPDLVPKVGITGTPVIDLASGTIYMSVTTREVTSTTNYYHRIHALNITNGTEQPYSPVVVTASFPGTGVDGDGSMVSFDPEQNFQRSGLTLVGGVLFVPYASYADTDPYHGWILGFNATNLQLMTNYIFCSTPDATTNDFGPHAGEGGIWMGGNGLCVDANTNIFFEVGNGSFSANTNGGDYGDTFVKLSATNGFAVADYFTPMDQAADAVNDNDLGSGGPCLLPDSAGNATHPTLMVGSGKDGNIYLVDRDNMGHYSSTANINLQTLNGAIAGSYGTPAYFNNWINYQSSGDVMKAFLITNGVMASSPISKTTVTLGGLGYAPVISANGTNNAIAWVIDASAYNNANSDTSSGSAVLRAFNATNLSQQLYNSSLKASDNAPGTVKYPVPTVADGKVFVAGDLGVAVYGIGIILPPPVVSPNGGIYTNSVTVTLADATNSTPIYYTLDGTMPTDNSILFTGPFTLTNTVVVSANAAQTGAFNSADVSASFINSSSIGSGTGLLGSYWTN